MSGVAEVDRNPVGTFVPPGENPQMTQPPDFPDLADVRAKYGPVMRGELHVDLESGNITGDGPMLAFWESLVDYSAPPSGGWKPRTPTGRTRLLGRIACSGAHGRSLSATASW